MPKPKPKLKASRRRLTAFIQLTLDGFFADVDGDISWAHSATDDPEWEAFVAENAKSGGMLVFGRVTYEMMAGYWSTAAAARNDPVVAIEMNRLPKVVFSRTLKKASWSNTTLVKRDLAASIRQLKQEAGADMAILGSGSLVSQLAEEGLIDELQIVVNPIVLGKGRPLFDSIKSKLELKLIKTRSFKNGNVLLCYTPAG